MANEQAGVVMQRPFLVEEAGVYEVEYFKGFGNGEENWKLENKKKEFFLWFNTFGSSK